jgi:hypothetical protein
VDRGSRVMRPRARRCWSALANLEPTTVLALARPLIKHKWSIFVLGMPVMRNAVAPRRRQVSRIRLRRHLICHEGISRPKGYLTIGYRWRALHQGAV